MRGGSKHLWRLVPPAQTQPETTRAHVTLDLKWLNGSCQGKRKSSKEFSKIRIDQVQGQTFCCCNLRLIMKNADIDECDDNNGNCTDNSNCFNIRGSYECRCKVGYEQNVTTGECDGKKARRNRQIISFLWSQSTKGRHRILFMNSVWLQCQLVWLVHFGGQSKENCTELSELSCLPPSLLQ